MRSRLGCGSGGSVLLCWFMCASPRATCSQCQHSSHELRTPNGMKMITLIDRDAR